MPLRRRSRRTASGSSASRRWPRNGSSSTAASRCRTKAASCSRRWWRPKRGELVVDFCAGAGGKTLALGDLMRSTGRLYALDVSAKRLAKLKPRLARSGLSNVHPVLIESERDPKLKRLAGKADRVLVDAPCSGLGTLRRNPDLKWRQSPASVAELTVKQASILATPRRAAEARRPSRLCDLQPARRREPGDRRCIRRVSSRLRARLGRRRAGAAGHRARRCRRRDGASRAVAASHRHRRLLRRGADEAPRERVSRQGTRRPGGVHTPRLASTRPVRRINGPRAIS